MAPKNLSFKIILGSSSMARRKILADMGYEFTVMSANIDEKSIRKDNAEELVVALAEAKADAIMSRLKTTDYMEKNTHPTLLITADIIHLKFDAPDLVHDFDNLNLISLIFKAISYIHLLVSRWRYTKELLEKNYQVRKKRSSSSNAILVVKPRL